MRKQRILIFGAGTLAKLMHYFCKVYGLFEIEAFIVDKGYYLGDHFLGLPVFEFENMGTKYMPKNYKMLVCVGYRDMEERKRAFDKIKKRGYDTVNYISPKAQISENVVFGENNIIFDNVTVEPFVKCGNNNIIWSDSLVCHDSKIGDHCFVASKTIIGGGAVINDSSFLGFNCIIDSGVVINRKNIVGAKAFVNGDTEEGGKYFGVPAKKYS